MHLLEIKMIGNLSRQSSKMTICNQNKLSLPRKFQEISWNWSSKKLQNYMKSLLRRIKLFNQKTRKWIKSKVKVYKIQKKLKFNKNWKTQEKKVNSKIQKISVLKNKNCKNVKKRTKANLWQEKELGLIKKI